MSEISADELHCVAVEGIKVSDYAEEHEELKTALAKWGAGKTGFQM